MNMLIPAAYRARKRLKQKLFRAMFHQLKAEEVLLQEAIVNLNIKNIN